MRMTLTRLAVTVPLFAWATASAARAEDVPEDQEKIVGHWQGVLKFQGGSLRIVFHIAKKEGGGLTASLDSPDQAAKGLPVAAVGIRGQAVQLIADPADPNGMQFFGDLSADGKAIVGKWKQGGQELPFTIEHTETPWEVKRQQEPKPPFPYNAEEVAIENPAAKGVTLAGTLTLPKEGGPFAVILLITGSGAQDRNEEIFSHKPFLLLADFLTRRGIAVLRLDDRGFAKSTGDFASATTADFASDAKAAVEYLKTRKDIDATRIGLLGHSEGGIVAPMLAAETKDIAFMVLLAAPAVTGEELLFAQAEAMLRLQGQPAQALVQQRATQRKMFEIVKASKDKDDCLARLREGFKEDLASPQGKAMLEPQFVSLCSPWLRFFLTFDPATALKKVKCPVLALYGEKDTQVLATQNGQPMETALKAGGNTNVTVEGMKGLNHLFQMCKSGLIQEYATIEETINPAVLEQIGTWLDKVTKK